MELWDQIRKTALDHDWDALRQIIESGRNDHHKAENIASVILVKEFVVGWGEERRVLGNNETPMELVNLALEVFAECDRKYCHPSWTHSLSHFTELLWPRGLMDWVKRFNEQAFGNAEKGWGWGEAFSCCDRLVGDVARYGNWATNPVELGITPERVDKAMDECLLAHHVKSLPFASERDEKVSLNSWILDHPTGTRFAGGGRATLSLGEDHSISWERVDKALAELTELGEDVSRWSDLKPEIVRLTIAAWEKERDGRQVTKYCDAESVAKMKANDQKRIDALQAELSSITKA